MGQECASHGQLIRAMSDSQGPGENLQLLCEDEDKLAKVCPKLEPIEVGAAQTGAGSGLAANTSAATLGLYLVATLGEAH